VLEDAAPHILLDTIFSEGLMARPHKPTAFSAARVVIDLITPPSSPLKQPAFSSRAGTPSPFDKSLMLAALKEHIEEQSRCCSDWRDPEPTL